MKIDGAIRRVLTQATLQNRETEVSASLTDFLIVIFLLSAFLLAGMLLFHIIKHKTLENFDFKDNALTAFWSTILLVLIAFAAYIVVLLNTWST
jgi:tellurite resistance protein TehA-like permease